MNVKQLLTIIFVLFSFVSEAQQYKKCKVFQYAGDDSLNQKLVSENKYNANGQLTYYYYKNYNESPGVANKNARFFNYYKDTFLIQSSSINEDKDSLKTKYYYNAKGQLIKEEHFEYTRRLKKNIDKGIASKGGCLISDKDYEKRKTWEKTSVVHIKYDASGNKVLYDATALHYSSQNKYTWKYDEQNRMLEHSSFEDDRLVWTEHFEYFDNEYMFTRTWYDKDGNPNELKTKNWEYWPRYSFIYKLNDKGQVMEEKVVTEKGEMTSSALYFYNSSGDIQRSTKFNKNYLRPITHLYVYE